MRRNYYFILLIFMFAIFNPKLNAQHLDAGSDIDLCPDETSTTLHAEINGNIYTGRYRVEAIQFQWDRFFDEAEDVTLENVPMRQDDKYSDPIDLPFTFNFFGTEYNQIVVGTNGDLIFNAGTMDDYDEWIIESSQFIPNHTLPYWDNGISFGSIMGAYYDIDISVPSTNKELLYKVSGEEPNRKFTIIYNEIPLFACNDLLASQEIVLNEIDNSIEVHLKNKPVCGAWNGGLALLGIQNDEMDSNTCGYYPGDATSPSLPNRNTGVWTVEESNPEAYKFIQDPNIVYTWKDADGNVIGNSADIEIEPTEDAIYTVEITYQDCHDNVYSESDTVAVNIIPEPQVEFPTGEIICPGSPISLDGTLLNEGDYSNVTYTWRNQNDEVIGNSPVLTVSAGGEYSLTVETDNLCEKTFEPVIVAEYAACQVPEGISPNGDGLNENFILDFYANTIGIDIFQVFDRRGVLVYEKDDYVNEFVGKDKDGNELPAATYYYVIKLLDGKKMTGWFQLIR